MRMRARGFSLVEILVALSVLSVISLAGVGVLRLASGTDEQVEALMAELGALDRTRTLLRGDLLALADRPYMAPDVRGPVSPFLGGREAEAVFGGGGGGDDGEETVLLALVRAGWANPGYRDPRGGLQHVQWIHREGALIRRTRPYLDATAATPFRDQVVMDNVVEADVAFWTARGWLEGWRWPQGGAIRAVRLTLEHDRLGTLINDLPARDL